MKNRSSQLVLFLIALASDGQGAPVTPVTSELQAQESTEATRPAIASVLAGISYLRPELVVFTCPAAMIEQNFGQGGLDIKDKEATIAELLREGTASKAILVTRTLYLWANPALDSASLSELPANALVFEKQIAKYDCVLKKMMVERYRLGKGFYTMTRSTNTIVVENSYNDHGLWMESKIYSNAGSIVRPVHGIHLRTYTTDVKPDARDLAYCDYNYRATVKDEINGDYRDVFFDNRNGYRKIRESVQVRLADVTRTINLTFNYSSEFCAGRIPVDIVAVFEGTPIKQYSSLEFDRDTQRYVLLERTMPDGKPRKRAIFDLGLCE